MDTFQELLRKQTKYNSIGKNDKMFTERYCINKEGVPNIEENTYKYFASLGGKSLKEFMSSMLSQTFVPNLAKELTWTGQRNNSSKDVTRALKDSKIVQIYRAAIKRNRKFEGATIDEIKKWISAGLKTTKEKIRTSNKEKDKVIVIRNPEMDIVIDET
ncbi:Protein of unknown function [Cotesia congregata]|uniref:DUF4806 domain-containing protein n=2 Tax=Cotesia congregata TaxID=51543 RepID=A0A8J2EIL3_COTCN|nr:Protein of unknown function [Cotesia congregata]